MKKIYSLLLLGGLLFVGAGNAWGGNYLSGTMNNWAESSGTEFVAGTATVFLAYNTTYDFEVYDNGYGVKKWSNSAAGTITSTTTYGDGTNGTYNKQLYDGGGTSHITTTCAGYYTFNLTWDGATPYLTVTYPTSSTTYTVTFDNSVKKWGIHAHIFNAAGNITGAYPGPTVSADGNNLCTYTFTSSEAPTQVYWNNGYGGDENQVQGSFVDKAIYNENGLITYSISAVTSDGSYATFYAPYNVLLPDGVDAYNTSLGSSTLSLSKNNSNVVPKNTAVILRGSAPMSLTATTKSAGSFSSCLTGCIEATDTSTVLSGKSGKTICVLGINDGKAGFFHLNSETLVANRAYLLVDAPWSSGVSGPAPSYRFIIEEENNTTSIENIEASEKAVKFFENGQMYILRDGVTYDITGRIVK